MFWRLVLAVITLLGAQTLQAEPLLLESGKTQNTLVELYTSEGCSSCPPAEALLNDFKHNQKLWHDIIPLAFHVDYWDYIGWKDRFASPAHSQRQRQYANLQRRNVVYTPAFIVNGKTWRPGLFSRKLPSGNKQTGNLKVVVNKQTISAHFQPSSKLVDKTQLNIALLGLNLKTRIKAGENEGRYAQHEFVVLQHKVYPANNNHWELQWNKLKTHSLADEVERYALAAWVSPANTPVPLQATGGFLPASLFR